MQHEKEYDIAKAQEAQRNYLKKLAVQKPYDWMSKEFAKGRGFAPSSGYCFHCNKNVYDVGGISVEEAGSRVTTGCPFCHSSFID